MAEKMSSSSSAKIRCREFIVERNPNTASIGGIFICGVIHCVKLNRIFLSETSDILLEHGKHRHLSPQICIMDDIVIHNTITIPASALTFKFTRSSGKGGQNVNKVATKVEMLLTIDDIRTDEGTKQRIKQKLAHRLDASGHVRIVSQESRSQWQNKQSALQKLVDLIADALLEEKDRIATKPTKVARKKRLEKKKRHGKKKEIRRTKHFADE